MKRIHGEKGGAIYMSDGYLTLALLRNRGEATPSGHQPFWIPCRQHQGCRGKKLQKIRGTAGAAPGEPPLPRNIAPWIPTAICSTCRWHGYDEAELQETRENPRPRKPARIKCRLDHAGQRATNVHCHRRGEVRLFEAAIAAARNTAPKKILMLEKAPEIGIWRQCPLFGHWVFRFWHSGPEEIREFLPEIDDEYFKSLQIFSLYQGRVFPPI